MSSLELDKHHRASPDRSNGEFSSIGEAMMAGGYFFGGSHLNSSDDEHEVETHTAEPAATTKLPPIGPASTSTNTNMNNNNNTSSSSSNTASPAAAPAMLTPQKGATPLSSGPGATPTPSTSNAESTRTSPMAAHSHNRAVDGAKPRRLSNDNTGSETKKADVAAGAVEPQTANNSTTLVSVTSAETATATIAAAAGSSSNNARASAQKNPFFAPRLPAPVATRIAGGPPATAAASLEGKSPRNGAAASAPDCSVHSTPPPRRPASENRDASVSVGACASSHPVPGVPKKPGTPDSAPSSATHRNTVSAPTAPVPPLSPKKANFAPMRRVSMTPHSSTNSTIAGAAGEGKPAPVVSRLNTRNVARAAATPLSPSANNSSSGSSNNNSNNHNNNSTTLNTTMPTSPFLAPAASGPNSNSPTPSPHPAPGFGGAFARPVAPSPAKTSPHASTGSPLARPRLASSRHSAPASTAAAEPHAPATAASHDIGALTSASPPPAGEVPAWLAELNNVLLQNPAAADAAGSGMEDSATEPPSSELAQHRTFSHAVTTSTDDWLNPCSRPKGLSTNAAFYAAADSQPAAGLPPGVTASQYGQHLREDTDDEGCRGGGSSQTSLTDTNTSVTRGTPNTKSISDSDVAASSSNHTAPFTGNRWRSEDGATVRRQYPSRHSSLAGSIGSADNVGFIPISREQRTMSPQSQRWESSGGLSLYSSVGESALTEQQQQQQQQQQQNTNGSNTMLHQPNGAPLGLGRRRESNSVTSRGGSGDIMAPVRLSRNDGSSSSCNNNNNTIFHHGNQNFSNGVESGGGGPAAAILASSTATLATGEVVQLTEMKQEPLVMPPMSRGFSLQPHLSSEDDLSLHMKSVAAAPPRYALSTESALGSASVLSTNEGPSSMRLPLARFMRNASTGSTVNGAHLPNHRALQMQLQQQLQPQQQMLGETSHNPNSGTVGPQRANSPPTVLQQQQQDRIHQQQQALAYAHPPQQLQPSVQGQKQQQQQPQSQNSVAGGRRGGPAVLSLRSESPNGEGVRGAAPTWNNTQSPHQPLRQGQVQALEDNIDFTASLTLTPTDAISNASRATSGLSLAAETTFVRCD